MGGPYTLSIYCVVKFEEAVLEALKFVVRLKHSAILTDWAEFQISGNFRGRVKEADFDWAPQDPSRRDLGARVTGLHTCCCAGLHCTAQHSTALHCTALHCTAQSSLTSLNLG